MDVNVPYDCILVQADIVFNLALEVLSDLQRNEQLDLRTSQTVSIDNIESNARHDQLRFTFGGAHAGSYRRRIQSFARTVSSVLRMCMLRSANASHYCPTFGECSYPRNRAKMVYSQYGPQFVLSTDRMLTMDYYSYYDNLYPHFKIEHQLESIGPNQFLQMPATMMLIFRRNFTKVIEISTNFQARDLSAPNVIPGTFQSYVNVRCIVRDIRNPEHSSLKLFKSLKQDACDILQKYQQGLHFSELPCVPYVSEFADQSYDESDSEEEEDKGWDSLLQSSDVITTTVAPPNAFHLLQEAPVMERLIMHLSEFDLKPN